MQYGCTALVPGASVKGVPDAADALHSDWHLQICHVGSHGGREKGGMMKKDPT